MRTTYLSLWDEIEPDDVLVIPTSSLLESSPSAYRHSSRMLVTVGMSARGSLLVCRIDESSVYSTRTESPPTSAESNQIESTNGAINSERNIIESNNVIGMGVCTVLDE